MAAQLAPVSPGDLITSSLINEIINRLGDLEDRMPDTRLMLGPLSNNTHTLVALGTGFEAGGGIWLDGNGVLTNVKRGLNVAVFSSTLTVKLTDNYDTWLSSSESARLVTDLSTRTVKGDIVVCVSHDAFAQNLTAAAKASLAAVGGAALTSAAANTRANGAFIGIVPNARTGVAYNYLASLLPADAPGFGTQLLVALPLVWGVYSIARGRFVLGAATHNNLGGTGTGATTGGGNVVGTVNVFDEVDKLDFLSESQKTKLKDAQFATIQDLFDASDDQVAQALGLKTQKQKTDFRSKLDGVFK